MEKPISDKDTFKLLLFFIGNGGSPDVIGEWIMTSQACASPRTAENKIFIYHFLLIILPLF